MCIIILDKRNSTERIPREVAERCLERNPHGMGLMYATGTELRVWHSLDDFEGLWNRYTGARDRGYPIALHFRWNTRGENTVENCHPFKITHDFAFMHNGTVTGLDSFMPKGVSDSQYMRDHLFPKLPGDFLKQPILRRAVERLVNGDRLLFMDKQGHYSIINAGQGTWEWGDAKSGVWFSHTRNRDYFMTGKKEWSYSGGKHSTRGSDRHFPGTGDVRDSHGLHRSAADDWYSRRPKQVEQSKSKEEVDAGPKQSQARVGSKLNMNLFFDYGSLLYEVPRDFKLLGPAVLKGGTLWEIKTAEGLFPAVIPSAVSGVSVQGKVYIMPENWSDAIAHLDVTEHPVYQRELMKVLSEEFGTLQCWTYTSQVGSEHSRVLAPVPLGNWEHYTKSKEAGESGATGFLGERKKGEDGWGVVKCRGCASENTQVHSAETSNLGIVTMVYCTDCRIDRMFRGDEEMVR